MDRNTVIGFILIGLVLLLFTWMNRPDPAQMEAQRRYQDSITHVAELSKQHELSAVNNTSQPTDDLSNLPDSIKTVQLQQKFGAFAQAVEGNEEFITLENDKVEIKISSKGGRLYYARLKDYLTSDQKPLILFDGDESNLNLTLVLASNRIVNTSDLYFTPIKNNDQSIIMRLSLEEGRHLDFTYSLAPDDYMLSFNIQGVGLNGILAPSTNTLEISWQQKLRQLEQGRKFENQYTGLYYKYSTDNVENLSETKDDDEQISNRLKWIGFKNKFFATVLIAEDAFTATRLQSKQFSEGTYLKEFLASTFVPFDLTRNDTISLKYFIGPNKYNLLKSYDNHVSSDQKLMLDHLVSLGMNFFRPINKYFIVPIFDFLGNHFTNYGIIILLLTLIVKMLLFPLTYKSYISSAKMRVLKPQVEEISAKYPKQEQAMERQKATMDLYSRAGASPMSGCLPMVLQLPILIALYGLFPNAIELRQESFLWAKDLSTFDSIISWDANIPLISSFLGNHISLFCLLMTLVNIVYTKFNMDATNTGQQQMPGMKMMMYIMPLTMFFIFNQNSAGLSYYFLVSTLITIIQTLTFRFTVNEEKLLLQLEENKKKPKKKSSFMQRLEDAQRMQQQQLNKQKEQRSKQQQQHSEKKQQRKK